GPAEVRALVEAASGFGEDELLRILELMTREEARIRSSNHPRFLLEALAIKLARLKDLRPIEELIARLGGAPNGPRDPDPGAPRARPGTQPPPGRSDAAAPGPPRPPAAARPPAPPVSRPRPAVAAPGPANPPSPQLGGEAGLVERILRRVHEERGALGGFLGQAAWAEIDGGSLTIAFQERHSFFREKVDSRDAISYLKRVAEEEAGRPLEIVVTVAAPAAIDTAVVSTEEAEASRRRRLREEAMKEPAVQTLLETFGGEIIDVEST
ncbi:MAG: hypothetical protein ACE5JH_08330, partial [Acidobacteriota bacterium]